MKEKHVLVTGATGYVGGRLVQLLLKSGYKVRAAVRSPEKFRAHQGENHPNLESVKADLLDPDSVLRAAEGCFAAYYLVHSLSINIRDFDVLERGCARNMVKASETAGLERIIYLGGLGKDDTAVLSRHLDSRDMAGKILSSGKVPVTILRAAVILGSGSASFEIIRYVVDRIPVIFAPRSLHTKCQPICIRNVLAYLAGCLEHPETAGQIYDIGGPDVITYAELLNIYAEEAGLKKRRILTCPFLTLRMASYLISLITPVPAPLVKALIEGLRNEVICRENRIRNIIPQELMTCRAAVRRALEKIEQQIVDTHYYDAGLSVPPEWADYRDAPYSGGSILECSYQIRINALPSQVWEPIKHIGGKNGWYFGGSLWWLRGFMDKLVGGVGMQRGRRDPENILVGDVLDCWRVLNVKPFRRLLLLGEMKLPGEAILEFRLKQFNADETELTMNARFLAKGLSGLAYWYSIYPLHDIVFKGMLQNIAGICKAPVTFGPQRV